MTQPSMFNQDYIQKIHDLNAKSPSDAKREIKNTLLSLERSIIKKANMGIYETPVTIAWNKFLDNKHSTDDLTLIVDVFYNDQCFRAKGLFNKQYAHAITWKWLMTDPIKNICKKTDWQITLDISNEYSIYPRFRNLIIDDNHPPKFELAKLYSLQNINKVNDLMESTKEYKQRKEEEVKIIKEAFSKINLSKLKPIKTMGYKVNFFTAWNALLSGKITEKQWRDLSEALSSDLYMKKLNIKKGVLELPEHTQISSSQLTCQTTGTSFIVGFNHDLSFSLKQWERKDVIHNGKTHYGGSHVPMKPPVFKDKIYEKTIILKSGKLLINDWFRCRKDAFNKAVKYDKVNFEINHAPGRVEQISYYAEKFNFASVNVGNTMPGIFKENNQIFIGEGPEGQELGSVCTDLWNASIIDEAQLAKILVDEGMSKEKANEEINYLKKIWTCKTLSVDPGTYKLSFCGWHEDFSARYKRKNKVPKGIKPYFVLEKISD